jgi:hypothetical protein
VLFEKTGIHRGKTTFNIKESQSKKSGTFTAIKDETTLKIDKSRFTARDRCIDREICIIQELCISVQNEDRGRKKIQIVYKGEKFTSYR